jgi:hypothetical protein
MEVQEGIFLGWLRHSRGGNEPEPGGKEIVDKNKIFALII